MNQQRIALLTDSCSDLAPSHIGEDPIYVVPLTVSWRGEEYEDGVTITADQVFEKAQIELPKTSLPRAESVYRTLEQIRQAGYQKVLAVMLSGGLSGTYNMMRLVAQDYTDMEIYVVDSVSASLGTGIIVLQLMEYIRRGYEWERLKTISHRLVQNAHVFLTLDTLEYLKKGGRIGKVTAIAGSLLNLKPIISFEEGGELVSVAKCRGARQAEKKILELMQKIRGESRRYVLVTAYSGRGEAYPAFRDEIARHFTDCEYQMEAVISATLGVYTGPGLLGCGLLLLDGVED